jgi:hypothetical protein
LEVILSELRERCEMNVPRCIDQRVKGADRREEFLDRFRIGDVYLEITALASDSDDLVSCVQCLVNSTAQSAGSADKDDLHGAAPSSA